MEKEELWIALENCRKEEKELRFSASAVSNIEEFGKILVQIAEEKKYPVALDIELSNFQIFHFSMTGATLYNNLWIQRKHRMVMAKHISSLHAGYLLKYQKQDLERDWLLDSKEYAIKGGGFPILLRNGTCIGSAACSGLPHEQDHRLITEALKIFLKQYGT